MTSRLLSSFLFFSRWEKRVEGEIGGMLDIEAGSSLLLLYTSAHVLCSKRSLSSPKQAESGC